MTRLIAIICLVSVGSQFAFAAPVTTWGPDAFALAAVVAQHSPQVPSLDKRAVARLFSGNANFGIAPNNRISVTADTVVCKMSNVDITERSCDLAFSFGARSLRGREANELRATMLAAGALSEGASGLIIESLSKVICIIDPNEIAKKSGGGAECTFETGQ